MKITDKYGNGIDLRTQFFSSTDLCTDPNNVGVVYPLKDTKGELQPSFGSVIDHQKGTILAFGEYRLAYGDGKEITYHKGRCLNIVTNDEYKTKVSQAESLFTIASETIDNTYLVTDNIPIKEVEFIKELVNLTKKLDYSPEYLINPDNIVEKTLKNTTFKTDNYEYPLFTKDPFTSYKIKEQTDIDEIMELLGYIDNLLFTLDKEPEEVLTKVQASTFILTYYDTNILFDMKPSELAKIKKTLLAAKKNLDAISNN